MPTGAGHFAVVQYTAAPVAVAPPRFLSGAGFWRKRTVAPLGAPPSESDVRWVDGVRRDAICVLLGQGVLSAAELDVANAVVGELVAYSLRYGAGPGIDVRLARFTGSVRVAVRGGPLRGIAPHEPDALALDENGVRLPLTTALATELHVTDNWISCSLALSTVKESA